MSFHAYSSHEYIQTAFLTLTHSHRHLSFNKEIEGLEEKLRDVGEWKSRLAEIESELAFTNP